MAHALATTCAAADRDFPTLGALARHLLQLAGGAEVVAGRCMATRGALPGGACVAVRALDGSRGGRGAFLGYAFIEAAPPTGLAPVDPALALRRAIEAITRANAVRPQSELTHA